MSSKLGMKTKLGFGIADLGGNLFVTVTGFYLLYFFTDVLFLSAGLASMAMFIGRLWDAVNDPVVGYKSDHTKSRWGRRRPWIFWGAILLFISMFLLFTPIRFNNEIALFLWVTFTFCFVNLAFTLVNIPYCALLPDLTDDYDQKTVLTGYRMSFAIIGTYIGAIAVNPIVNLFKNPDTGWSVMGGVLGLIMMITALVTFFVIREPKRENIAVEKKFFKSYLELLKNKTLLTAMIPWMFFALGVTVTQSSLIYYFIYVLGDEASFPFALIALLTASLIFIPIWVKLSEKIGKKYCYIIGMGIVALGLIAVFIFGTLGSTTFIVIIGITGIGFSTHYVMPHSIIPDVIEEDTLKTGNNREGSYYSLWNFTFKVGQFLAFGIAGLVLKIFKYVPEAVQTAEAVLGIRLLCGIVPMVFIVIGIVILFRYPITRKYYDSMLESLSED